MINTRMTNEVNPPEVKETQPHDTAGFHFSGGIKITDPETKEVLAHIRTD
jgi:hypothetical protein